MNTKMHGAAALALMLLGCASGGPKIDAERLTEVRKGETSYAEVVKRFGRPSFYSKNLNGTHTAVYVHADAGSNTAVVPLIAALAGADANADSVAFYFDDTGVLRDYKISQRAPSPPAVATAVEPGRAPAPSRASGPSSAASDPSQPIAPDVVRVRPVRTQTGSESGFLPGNTWTIHTLQPSGSRENR